MIEREWCVCPTHNYLVIQKCGNSYVRDIFKKFYGDDFFIAKEANRNLRWTVVRNPRERFISGLAYDIWKNNYKNYDSLFSNIDKIVQYPVSSTFYNMGRVKHTILQSAYLVLQNVDVFVEIKDLTEFCLLNFGMTSDVTNSVPDEYTLRVKTEITDRNLQQRIDDLISNDVYLYNQIMNSDRLWCWQNGNILGTQLKQQGNEGGK